MSQSGGMQKHVLALKVKGLDAQSVLLAQVAAHVHLQVVLVQGNKHHPDMIGQLTLERECT